MTTTSSSGDDVKLPTHVERALATTITQFFAYEVTRLDGSDQVTMSQAYSGVVESFLFLAASLRAVGAIR